MLETEEWKGVGVGKGIGGDCGILKTREGGVGDANHEGGPRVPFYLWVKRGKEELLELSSGTRCFM